MTFFYIVLHTYVHVYTFVRYVISHVHCTKLGFERTQSFTLAKLRAVAYEHQAKLINIKLFVRRREGHISGITGNIAMLEQF